MLPTLALHAAHPGILYINGHFAGETGPAQPLLRPVNARGPVYLEYRPLSGGCLPMARRLVFSGGAPMAESAREAEGLNIILWPGGVTELEFMPEERAGSARTFRAMDRSFSLEGGRLYCEGRQICILPEGAQEPRCMPMAGGVAFMGQCRAGCYLLTMDEACARHTGLLTARQIDPEPDGRVRAICDCGDLVGHATLENWRLTTEGLVRISAESAWAHGAPRWPHTPEETMRAAVEAALAGLDAEAEGYLSPILRSREALTGLREKCDLCVEMKYAPPGARPCVGLLRLEEENMGRVQPLYFRATSGGSSQGPCLIDDVEFG